jgi:penicillin amidase
VAVVRDVAGVPHVEAATLDDALAGLGLAHAQDRLWQMELLRRSARGTLSELFGRSTLRLDRLARTLGLAEAASREESRLDPGARALLESYARGVNAWIREMQTGQVPTPVEFGWFGVEPDPWAPADTLAIVRLRAWMLGRSLGASLLLDRLVQKLGGVASAPFFPALFSTLPAEDLVRTWTELGRVADSLAGVNGLRGRVGSIGLVIGPERSASGLPLLANDPHVEFQLPPVFYLAHLRAASFEVAGATWPGVPVFWTGTTLHSAWGQVALHANASDLFVETIHPSDAYRYDVRGRWKQTDRREEHIRVRGAGDEHIEVLTTRHGPLLVSVLPEDKAARKLALQWTGQHRRSGIRALLALPRARSFAEFREALRDLPAPPTVFLYADRTPAVALQIAGDLPVRPIDTGLLPVPGRSGWYDWRGTLAYDELPYRTQADAAWLVAGPRGAGLAFPIRVAWLWSATGATERLRHRLETSPKLELEDVLALQRETHNSSAPAGIRKILDGVQPRSSAARRVHKALRAWDGSTSQDAAGSAVYHAFRMRLLGHLLERHLPGDQIEALLKLAEPVPGRALAAYLARTSEPVDEALIETVLEETWSWLTSEVSSNPAKWTWGQTHRLRLSHPFERLGRGVTALIGRTLSRGPFPAPGDPGSVWAMFTDGTDPFRPRVGPAFRFAVDLADPVHSRFGLCGGQSGIPGSPTYEDGVEPWIEGRAQVLWMHAADVAYHAQGTWQLRPGAP